jgi:hypothetical protein
MEELSRRFPAGCSTGDAVATSAGKLRARVVIHAVGPSFIPQEKEWCAERLAQAYRNSLQLAAEHGCRSVAFPSISTGVFHYPTAEAARIALQTARFPARSWSTRTRPARAGALGTLRRPDLRRIRGRRERSIRGFSAREIRHWQRRSDLFRLVLPCILHRQNRCHGTEHSRAIRFSPACAAASARLVLALLACLAAFFAFFAFFAFICATAGVFLRIGLPLRKDVTELVDFQSERRPSISHGRDFVPSVGQQNF